MIEVILSANAFVGRTGARISLAVHHIEFGLSARHPMTVWYASWGNRLLGVLLTQHGKPGYIDRL